jgi:predicted XRE-type DNA-binding protein
MTQRENKNRETALGTVGSGNVFADLGLPNADELLCKAKLVSKIAEVIDKRDMTQAQAGALMGLPQSKVSELCSGRTETYSSDRLYRLLARLGVRVTVTLEEQPDWSPADVEIVETSPSRSEREHEAEPLPAP